MSRRATHARSALRLTLGPSEAATMMSLMPGFLRCVVASLILALPILVSGCGSRGGDVEPGTWRLSPSMAEPVGSGRSFQDRARYIQHLP